MKRASGVKDFAGKSPKFQDTRNYHDGGPWEDPPASAISYLTILGTLNNTIGLPPSTADLQRPMICSSRFLIKGQSHGTIRTANASSFDRC